MNKIKVKLGYNSYIALEEYLRYVITVFERNSKYQKQPDSEKLLFAELAEILLRINQKTSFYFEKERAMSFKIAQAYALNIILSRHENYELPDNYLGIIPSLQMTIGPQLP